MSEQNDQEQELIYDLNVRQKSVKVKDYDGQVVTYAIKELVGEQRDHFLNNMNRRMLMSADGKQIGVKDHTGIMADLLVRSVVDQEGSPVSLKVVQGWPATVQEAWFRIAVELSSLGTRTEEQVKND